MQAKNAASAVSLSVSDSKPKPTVELFGSAAGKSEVSNELRLHRTDLETPEKKLERKNGSESAWTRKNPVTINPCKNINCYAGRYFLFIQLCKI